MKFKKPYAINLFYEKKFTHRLQSFIKSSITHEQILFAMPAYLKKWQKYSVTLNLKPEIIKSLTQIELSLDRELNHRNVVTKDIIKFNRLQQDKLIEECEKLHNHLIHLIGILTELCKNMNANKEITISIISVISSFKNILNSRVANQNRLNLKLKSAQNQLFVKNFTN